MNTGAKRTVIIMFILITLLCGCNSAETSSEKLIKVSKITDLIFADEALIPNPDFSWGMEQKDFLANVYGSETMDPNSESFDEQRYFYSEEQNVTTCSPPITYRVKDISVDAEDQSISLSISKLLNSYTITLTMKGI